VKNGLTGSQTDGETDARGQPDCLKPPAPSIQNAVVSRAFTVLHLPCGTHCL